MGGALLLPVLLLLLLCARAPAAETDTPEALLQQAAELIQQKVQPRVHLLELWGPDLTTQGELAPDAQKAVDLLGRAAEAATQQMHEIASRLKGPDDPQIQQWESASRLEQGAEYTRHITQYALALSMDQADPKRLPLISSDVDYLQQFDTTRSGVQVLVRLRLARLRLLAGQYPQAQVLLDSLRADPSSLNPAPSAAQRLDALRLQVISALARHDVKQAATLLSEWPATPSTSATTTPAMQAAHADEQVLRYRLLLAQADASPNSPAGAEHLRQAHQLLAALLKVQPEFWPIARRRLIARAGDAPITALDDVTLEAFLQQADIQRQQSDPDRTEMQKGLSAARQLLSRHPPDASLQDQAAILVPVLLEKLDHQADAASAFLDYADKGEGKYRQAALNHAQWIIAHLRQDKPDDAQTKELYRRFLILAVQKLGERQFAYEYAQLLQSGGEYRQAIEYYRMTRPGDPQYAQSRLRIIDCLSSAGDLSQAAGELADVLRDGKIPAWNLLQPMLDRLNDAYDAALSAADQQKLRIIAQARASLSPRLAAHAAANSNNKSEIAEARLYDADCRRQWAQLQPQSPQRRQTLQSLVGEYQSLQADPTCQTRARTGEALTAYAMGQWQRCIDLLRPLLESAALGDGVVVRTQPTGKSESMDNPAYWEARYALLQSQWNLGADQPPLRHTVGRDLAVLQAKWGSAIGGRAYHRQFEALIAEVGR